MAEYETVFSAATELLVADRLCSIDELAVPLPKGPAGPCGLTFTPR